MSGSVRTINVEEKLKAFEKSKLKILIKMKPMNETNKRMNKIRNKYHFAETLDKG